MGCEVRSSGVHRSGVSVGVRLEEGVWVWVWGLKLPGQHRFVILKGQFLWHLNYMRVLAFNME